MRPIDLKIERVRRGVRQFHLAAALGIPPTTLSKIENGQQRVSRERLAAMAATLDEIAALELADLTASVRDVGVA